MVKGANTLPAIGRPDRCSPVINYVVAAYRGRGEEGTVAKRLLRFYSAREGRGGGVYFTRISAEVLVTIFFVVERQGRRERISLQSSAGPIIKCRFRRRPDEEPRSGRLSDVGGGARGFETTFSSLFENRRRIFNSIIYERAK